MTIRDWLARCQSELGRIACDRGILLCDIITSQDIAMQAKSLAMHNKLTLPREPIQGAIPLTRGRVGTGELA